MARTVTARFETEAEAEQALSAVAGQVPLRDSAVLSHGLAGMLTLDSLHLSPEERAECEHQLAKGGFLLVAQLATESRAETVARLLEDIRRGREPGAPPIPQQAPETQAAPPAPSESAPPPPSEAMAEERIPILEEELRIGKREVVRGRSRVHAYVTEVPVQEEVELLHEETRMERRPVNRRVTEEEVVRGGLLQERVIEISEMREEAVVTKEAFVREELVVKKSLHRRVEQINETVRRTEVETERLEPEESNASGG